MQQRSKIECYDCGEELPDEWIASDANNQCPNCGSCKQKIELDFFEEISVEVHDTFRGKEKDPSLPSKKKLRKDIITGDDIRKRDGKWMRKERIIDRDNDYYKEKVVDPETGDVVHECEEKLSDHLGHGSNKPKKS